MGINSRFKGLIMAVMFEVPNAQNTTLISLWCNRKRQYLSLLPTTSTFSEEEKSSHSWKPIYDLALQQHNICVVYLWCKIIRFLSVGHCWTEAIYTEQNKSHVQYIFFVLSVVNLQKRSHKKCHSWTQFHRSRKPKCVLKPCCKKVPNS